jgi:hypothetical protein
MTTPPRSSMRGSARPTPTRGPTCHDHQLSLRTGTPPCQKESPSTVSFRHDRKWGHVMLELDLDLVHSLGVATARPGVAEGWCVLDLSLGDDVWSTDVLTLSLTADQARALAAELQLAAEAQ